VNVVVVLGIEKCFSLGKGGVDANPTERRSTEELRFIEARVDEPVVDSLDRGGGRRKSLGNLFRGPVLLSLLVME